MRRVLFIVLFAPFFFASIYWALRNPSSTPNPPPVSSDRFQDTDLVSKVKVTVTSPRKSYFIGEPRRLVQYFLLGNYADSHSRPQSQTELLNEYFIINRPRVVTVQVAHEVDRRDGHGATIHAPPFTIEILPRRNRKR